MTFGDQTFRNDKKEALSYFTGGDPAYPNNKNFALTPRVDTRQKMQKRKMRVFNL